MAAMFEIDTAKICAECAVYMANADVSGCEYQWGEKRAQAVVDGVCKLQTAGWSMGDPCQDGYDSTHCPSCGWVAMAAHTIVLLRNFPEAHEPCVLRDVTVFGRRLLTWEDYHAPRSPYGHTTVRFAFFEKRAKAPFFVSQVGIPAHECIDSDASLEHILSYLAMKVGDTDRDFFDDYTPDMLEWSESDDAQTLGLVSSDLQESGSEESYYRYNKGGRIVDGKGRRVLKDRVSK